ncbi:MAG TPA: hypothetical protein VIY48_12410 [Candidatus Paceibacterota bacterium]
MNEPTFSRCDACIHIMNGADDLPRCRINGLEASSANADGCKKFIDDVFDYMMADQVRPWCSK